MNHLKYFFFYLFCLSVTVTSLAQTAVWSLHPGNYVEIQCIGKHTYKVTHIDGHSSVMSISADGKAQSIVTCDEITPFYKNWALLIKHEEKKRRVIGSLSSDGTCNLFKAVFYTLTNQEFYSEGLLTVENDKGEKVYIDYQGNERIGTGKKYKRIKPFSEGYAVVFNDDQKSNYINKDGQILPIRSSLLNNVELFQVMNFYQGRALMMGKNKDYFICDIEGNGEKLSKKPESLEYDYLYRFVSNNDNVQKTPPYDPVYKGVVDTLVKLKVVGKGKNTRYGYSMVKDSKTMLPCQFSLAEPFIDSFAIVKMTDGKQGILHLSSDAITEFNVSTVNKTIQFDKPAEPVTCQFTISPVDWRGSQIQAQLAEHDGVEVKSEGNGLFSFIFFPSERAPQKTFKINLLSEGLLLTTRSITIEFKKKEPPKCTTCHLEISKCKDKGKHKNCTDKQCGRVIDHNGIVKDRCPKNGKHPKIKDECPRCGQPIKKCSFKGHHPNI